MSFRLRNNGPIWLGEFTALTEAGLSNGCSCRLHGASSIVPDGFNLALHVGDEAELVNANRRQFAAALGVDAVLCTPACCDPLYRRAVRVSMGTVFQVPWTRIGDQPGEEWPQGGIAKLRSLGFKTAAMALDDNSVSLDCPELKKCEKLAIVMGTEGDGLSQHTIAACDYTVRIPMAHGVDSLNVAAASAVAFWELRAR